VGTKAPCYCKGNGQVLS